MVSRLASEELRVAIVGGGITGACAAAALLSSAANDTSKPICIDLFDQGQRGPGGRASHRRINTANGDPAKRADAAASEFRFDHGAQFFRADTDRFRQSVLQWIDMGIVHEWKGTFLSDAQPGDENAADRDFFGLLQPPIYVGSDGMNSVITGILDNVSSCAAHQTNDGFPHSLKVHKGTRVVNMKRDASSCRWELYGTSGEIAYHDTAEAKVKEGSRNNPAGDRLGRQPDTAYDVVLLTDVSSSFGSWHRASAGGPEDFACRVRERVGARVPLFTAMVSFASRIEVPFDAASFINNETIWFAARSSSKPGMSSTSSDCWTIVSTPDYALKQIAETPMQDPITGAFIPQPPSYLTTVPGPDLERAFREAVSSPSGILGSAALDPSTLPATVHIDAQRWGSALPCHRHLGEGSTTRAVVSGVPYDCCRAPLAPTKLEERVERGTVDHERSFLADDGQGLVAAGDMMSRYTPGFEGAALSGMDAAEHVLHMLSARES